MTLNDRIIARAESFYTDEFERAQLHKSATAGMYWTNYLSLAMAPLLAWLLDGRQAYLSFLALIPISIGTFTSTKWLSRTVPHPKLSNFRHLWSWEWAFIVAVIVAWIAALISNNAGAPFYANGTVTGAIAGFVAVMLITPLYTGWLRKRDQRRLESELED
ncbi:hypothetical protein [Corynebacterium hindlerae]|uniref:hypothetical protein n=1 Tax=Corynebacterium hindlerae TaxID=699041 RepID=UPI0031B72950